MDIPDRIERTLVLPAPRERVWKAISTPEEIARWFGDRVAGDFRVGGDIVFGFGETFRVRARILAIEPPNYFAYRWLSYPGDPRAGFDTLPSTLVEFRLQEIPEGTRLTLVESGFAGLPAELRAKALSENSGGWQDELGDLENYLKTRHDSP